MASCKSHSGTFCTKPNFVVSCFELKRNGEFKYDQGSCTGDSQGSGNYEIHGDSIVFKFSKNSQTSRSVFKIEKKSDIDKGIIVDLTVVDLQTKEPIVFYSAAIYSNKVLLGGKAGDLEGKANLVASFNQQPISIEVSNAGYYPINIEINEPGKYSVMGQMKSGGFNQIQEQDWIFKLVDLNKDSLVMEGFEDEGWSQTFLRNEKKKYKK